MKTVCIVGLGYVGLPLLKAFNEKHNCIGFDVNKKRINELKKLKDSTSELNEKELKKIKSKLTTNPKKIKNADFVIVAVPTPITKSKKPDLTYIKSASKLVGKNLKKGSIVIFESTVYPGITENVCLPIIEKESKLKCPEDFQIGYSPERINPGDKKHTLTKITKVVSGFDKKSSAKIAKLYGSIIEAGVYKAPSIKVAEAAKVIENTQRDINIALINELTLLFGKAGIDTKEVLKAANTKWNFLDFKPGLIGGHCIPVDPYYLVELAKKLKFKPKMIIAGRKTNDSMKDKLIQIIEEKLKEISEKIKGKKILVLGATFKENVPDTRNSLVKGIIQELKKKKANVKIYDPLIESKRIFGCKNISLNEEKEFDVIILAVKHKEFNKKTLKKLKKIRNKNAIFVDPKWVYSKKEVEKEGFLYITF